MPRFPRPMSFDQPSTSGPLERVAPRFESTITASTSPLPESVSAKCRAPASPSWPPSTDASTSVFVEARPSNTRANSMRAAVSAALPASSGTVAASRAAITTISLFVLPGRRPITFTSLVPSWSKWSTVVEKPWLRNVCFTRDATAASPGRPARRSGVVVLDVMLPHVDGFEVCRQLRARSSVPIIMLTAKAEEFDKVLGLELGADDYITKPFSMREFRSRVKAVLRRADLRSNGDRSEEPLEERDVRIDFGKRQVEVRGGQVKLTYVEFEILAILARSPGRVFSRTMLLERLWGAAAYRDPRTIDVSMRHLREKIERDPREPELIRTVRGVGYHLRDR